jgi:hypothetical protein
MHSLTCHHYSSRGRVGKNHKEINIASVQQCHKNSLYRYSIGYANYYDPNSCGRDPQA